MTFAIVNNIFPMRPPFTAVQFLPASDKPQNDFHHDLRNASAFHTGPGNSALLLFVMRPEAQDLDDPLLLEHLIDHAMLDIDPAGVRAGKIADKLLEWRMGFKGIFFEDFQDTLRLFLETGSGKFLRVLLCLRCIHELPAHQTSFSVHFLTGVFIPDRMDSRIPGIESR